MCLSQLSDLHRGFGNSRRKVTRLCLTFQRSSLAGFFVDLGDSLLIRRRCRYHQSFRIAWTTRLWPMWVRPGRSRALRPRSLSPHRLSPDVHRPFSGSPVGVLADLPNYLTGRVGRRSPGLVPRWRLAREGPFLAERSSSSLRCFGAGCAFRNTTYRPSVWHSSAPSPISGMDWHPRVG